MENRTPIVLLMPCSAPIDPDVFQSTLIMTSFAAKQGYLVEKIGIAKRTLIHSARNLLSLGFLDTECEWALWLDSDMIIDQRCIPIMMNWAKKLNAKFLTGVYYQRCGKYNPVLMVRHKSKTYKNDYEMSPVYPMPDSKTPFKVDACGFGCVLMHRSVLEIMDKPYFRFIFDGTLEVSEDFYFCLEAKKKGIDVWAVPELENFHLGEPEKIGWNKFKDNYEEYLKKEGKNKEEVEVLCK